MPRVKLIAVSRPLTGNDPRRLVVLAVKVSSGKLHERDAEHYLSGDYSDRDVSQHIVKAWAYPSVLEHVVFTFLIEDISRVCSHQLVRHRIASYTQESQRFSESYMARALKLVEEALRSRGIEVSGPRHVLIEEFLRVASRSEIVSVCREAFVIPPRIDDDSAEALCRSLISSIARYYELVDIRGARLEDARFVVPQAVKTRILVTMNLRELIHVACLRLRPEAQWEIREVVRAMVEEAKNVVPEIEALIDRMCVAER